MKDALSYWSPLCHLVMQLRCWVRMAWRDGASTQEGDWGQLLTIPVDGYLEVSSGPVPFRDVDWIEVSMNRVRGGMAGRPLQMLDVKEEILADLRGMQVSWEFRDSTWSMEGVFEERPVQVIRITNPFGLKSRS
jgi:hypothetical protein